MNENNKDLVNSAFDGINLNKQAIINRLDSIDALTLKFNALCEKAGRRDLVFTDA